ncbi:hypothetical protein EMPS_07872 [Entomortierella parvispora]|uniref:WD40 repeat-like protein n=1 Tax=Entomortierella parvispora TaxID=205924 RepID=A0A9P3HF03_9FUNG|nr:hypothetical protein EMPS_07872 [Entomortierella parvispora]
MSSTSLSIPIAFWTRGISFAAISSVYACGDRVIAGFEDGLICVLRNKCTASVNSSGDDAGDILLEPAAVLIGHLSRITAFTGMIVQVDTKSAPEWVLYSASEDGEVKKWNLADGRCLQSSPDAFIGVPTYLGVFSGAEMLGSGPKFIICAGMSHEACILDSTSLEVVRVWGGHLEWLHCTVLPGDDQNQSRFLSVSADCKLSLWVFDTSGLTVVKSKVFEICPRLQEIPVSLVACCFSASRAALVTRGCIQVICMEQRKAACYVIHASRDESFAGAKFISLEEIAAWTQSGQVFVYSLSAALQRTELTAEQTPLELHSFVQISASWSNPTAVVEVSDREPSPTYMPNVMIVSTDKGQCHLNLQSTQDGLRYTYALLHGNEKETEASADLFPEPFITFSLMLSDELLALGHSNGNVWIGSIEDAIPLLTASPFAGTCKDAKLLQGHVGPVSCIFTSEDLLERSFVLTGGKDCSSRIWNIDAGREVACFNNHSRPIEHYFQVPEDGNTRMKRTVISVAEDHSVAIISIEEMSCIFLFGGYTHTLKTIQWRPPEDYVVLWYTDETAFVWQIQTGHLDRIVKGEAAREIMMDSRWKVSQISAHSYGSKWAFECTTLQFGNGVYIPILQLNLKHIQNILVTGRMVGRQGEASSALSGSGRPTSTVRATSSRQMATGASTGCIAKDKLSVDQYAQLSDKAQRCLRAARAVLGLLVTEDNAHAISIRALLGLPRPEATVTLGMKGNYGNISIQVPVIEDAGASWCTSPTLTASKLITILSLSKTLAAAQNLDVDMDTWSRGYCTAVQDAAGAGFCQPSLSYLAKYWQDPQVEVQEATKIVLMTAIERMSKGDIAVLVKYWSSFLPAAAQPDACSSQYMARSAVILGIIGAENADALPEKVCKLVALSLTILLNDDSRLSYKVASIDLLAQGFASWQPFIKADAVLKTLFSMAMDPQPNGGVVSRRARRAITQIASVNSVLFVTTLTQEILDAKKPIERIGLLKLISIFTRKDPAVLYLGLSRLAEAIVKSLDPTVPHIREQMLPVGTSVMMDLVLSYPQLDFHVGSQKLAVGTLEGAIVVYDLQTATRWQILEGHARPVSAVSFSRDGKTIVSCCLKEGTVRFWHPNPGFFGMLMAGNGIFGTRSSGSGSVSSGSGQQGGGGMPSLSSQQSSKTFDFALQESVVVGSEESMLNHVRFEWTGDRAVKLSVYDHIMSFNI